MDQEVIKTISRLIIGCTIFILSSCIHMQTAEEKLIIDQCSVTCEQKAQQCSLTCRNNCNQCRAYARQSTSESYLYYRHEQYLKCAPLARDLHSYRDPLQCRKITCSCAAGCQIVCNAGSR